MKIRIILSAIACLFSSACFATGPTTPINNGILTGVLQLNQSSTTGTAVFPVANLGTGTPSVATVLYGNGVWGAIPSSVATITGTANEVLVNGTSGTPEGGAVTLTLPQAIATTSTPTFGALTVTNNVTITSGSLLLGTVGILQTLDVFGSHYGQMNMAQSTTGYGFDIEVGSTGSPYEAMFFNATGNVTAEHNFTVVGIATITGNLVATTGTSSFGTIGAGTWNGNPIAAAYLPTGTTSTPGILEPDGVSIDVSSGVISVVKATNSVFGVSKPDGTTITVSGGVISAVGGGGGGGNVSTSGTITSGYTAQWNGATSIAAIANTGTGDYVLAISPTFAGTIVAANLTASGTVDVTTANGLEALSPVFTGTVSAVAETLSGLLTAPSPTFTGTVSGADEILSGALSVADAATFGSYITVNPGSDPGTALIGTNGVIESTGKYGLATSTTGIQIYYDPAGGIGGNGAGEILAYNPGGSAYEDLTLSGQNVNIGILSLISTVNLKAYTTRVGINGEGALLVGAIDTFFTTPSALISIGDGTASPTLTLAGIFGPLTGPKIILEALGSGGANYTIAPDSKLNGGTSNALDISTSAAGANIAMIVDGGLSATFENGSVVLPALLDLSASTAGQILFPATQHTSSNANTLDDYSKGTWTPTLNSFTTTGSITVSGFYIKVGHHVHILCQISSASSGTITNSGGFISGVPFTAAEQESGSWIEYGPGAGGAYLTGTSIYPTNWSSISLSSSGNPLCLSFDFIQ